MNDADECASLVEVNEYFTENIKVHLCYGENFVDFSDLENPV